MTIVDLSTTQEERDRASVAAAIADEVLTIKDPADVARLMRGLDDDQFAAVERCIADRVAIGWRATPATMAHHLTMGRLKMWRYTRLLGEKFRQLVKGESIRQIWNIEARYGKPVAVDELVMMADGSLVRLGDVEVGDFVISHLGRPCRVLAVHEQGVIPVVRIVTAAGRSIAAAPDHPFLVPDGWLAAGELTARRPGVPGDVLGVVVPDETGATTRTAEEFRLAGYFVGDGSVTFGANGTLACEVTCADATEGDDLFACAEKMGWRATARPYAGTALRYSFARGGRAWLRETGIAGGTSHTKRVPAWVFTAPTAMIAEFVGAYFACDGSVSKMQNGQARGRALEFASVNRALLTDVRSLLARLGIYGRVSGKLSVHGTNYVHGPHQSYRLTVTGSDAIARFAALVPVHHAKADRLRAAGVRRQQFASRWLPDEVLAVEPADVAECRCLTIAGDSSFVAGDVAVHNSLWASRWGPAWGLDLDPTLNFMLSSYGDTLADENADAVRQIIRTYSNELRVELRRDRQARSRFVTSEGGGLVAAGLDAGLSGFPADVGVLDDPFKNWQDAHSEARRDHVENQYRAVIRLRAETDRAGILIVHNRWHDDDLTGRLVKHMEDGTGEAWDVVRLPTIAQEPDPKAAVRIFAMPDLLGRKPGELLEPERFSAEGVAARALALGSYLASAVQGQRPSPEEGNDVKRGWFRIEDRMPDRADEWLSSWDTKMKDNEQGDFVVGQVWCRTGKDCWLMDQLRGQWDRPTTVAAVALMAIRWPQCTKHAIEAAALGPEVKEDLITPQRGFVLSDDIASQLGMTDDERLAVQELRRRGLGGIVMNPVSGDKRARLRLVTPYIEAGDVHLWERASYLGGYLDELAAFPNGTHDDQCDVTSQALALLHKGTASRRRRLSGDAQRAAAATTV